MTLNLQRNLMTQNASSVGGGFSSVRTLKANVAPLRLLEDLICSNVILSIIDINRIYINNLMLMT